jgi:hypothetical protein
MDLSTAASRLSASSYVIRTCLVYLIWYSFPQQVASVAKGVTARGVAAAAGAGLGIGFRGDPASAAKQAELLTQREYYAKQLEHLNSMRERGESSVGRCNPIRLSDPITHARMQVAHARWQAAPDLTCPR